jgi:nucleotide-binding universal stress UspA family protein
MIKHILVPLDGSRMAESSIPAAVFLAKIFKADVALIHVIEEKAPSEVHGEPHLRLPDEAQAYLDKLASEKFPSELKVVTHVHQAETKNVPRSIIEHVHEFESDLIVMCSHGRGGMRNVLHGSIAQQVINIGITPVLIIYPDSPGSTAPFSCRSLLIPLDGDPDHEHSIPYAVELVKACPVAIHLLMVIPTYSDLSGEWVVPSRYFPGATTRLLDESKSTAEEYLREKKQYLEEKGIKVIANIFRGDIAEVIAEAARDFEVDMIVMGTHGKRGLDAFWSGSITPKVARHYKAPTLLVPVNPKQAEDKS